MLFSNLTLRLGLAQAIVLIENFHWGWIPNKFILKIINGYRNTDDPVHNIFRQNTIYPRNTSCDICFNEITYFCSIHNLISQFLRILSISDDSSIHNPCKKLISPLPRIQQVLFNQFPLVNNIFQSSWCFGHFLCLQEGNLFEIFGRGYFNPNVVMIIQDFSLILLKERTSVLNSPNTQLPSHFGLQNLSHGIRIGTWLRSFDKLFFLKKISF